MLAFLMFQLALAAPSIPPADQTAPPPSQQQQPVGEATEQKGETPTTTTQANAPSAEMKPSNGAPSGATTTDQPSRTANGGSTGGSGATTAPAAKHKGRRHKVRGNKYPPQAY